MNLSEDSLSCLQSHMPQSKYRDRRVYPDDATNCHVFRRAKPPEYARVEKVAYPVSDRYGTEASTILPDTIL